MMINVVVMLECRDMYICIHMLYLVGAFKYVLFTSICNSIWDSNPNEYFGGGWLNHQPWMCEYIVYIYIYRCTLYKRVYIYIYVYIFIHISYMCIIYIYISYMCATIYIYIYVYILYQIISICNMRYIHKYNIYIYVYADILSIYLSI